MTEGRVDMHAIETKFSTRLWIHLGMDIAKYNSPLSTTGGISGGFRGSQI